MIRILIVMTCMLIPTAAEAGLKTRLLAAGAITVCTRTNFCKAMLLKYGEAAILSLAAKYGVDGMLQCAASGSCVDDLVGGALESVPSLVSPGAAGLEPPGNCGDDEYRQLVWQVDYSCKGKHGGVLVRSCKGNDDIFTLEKKLGEWDACNRARVTRENTCFNGGNKGHDQQITQTENGFYKCMDFIGRIR